MSPQSSICSHCSAPLPAAAETCTWCGAILVQDTTPRAKRQPAAALVCPTCKSDDMIQKLTSIVSGGTSETVGQTRTSGSSSIDTNQRYYNRDNREIGTGQQTGSVSHTSTTRIYAKDQSLLAQRVSPPPEPEEPQLAEYGFPDWIGGVAVGTAIAATVLYGGLWTTLTGDRGEIIAPCILGPFTTFLLYLALDNALFDKKRKAAKAEYEEAVEKHAVSVSDWEDAMARWEQMYYCHRDDVVFIPNENVAVPPERVGQLCYVPPLLTQDR